MGLITGMGFERLEIFVFVGPFGDEFTDRDWTAREVVLVNGTAAQLYVDDSLVALCLPAPGGSGGVPQGMDTASRPKSVCIGSDIDDEDTDPDASETRARIEANTRRVREIAEGLRIAPDLDDKSTWFDARDALPR